MSRTQTELGHSLLQELGAFGFFREPWQKMMCRRESLQLSCIEVWRPSV